MSKQTIKPQQQSSSISSVLQSELHQSQLQPQRQTQSDYHQNQHQHQHQHQQQYRQQQQQHQHQHDEYQYDHHHAHRMRLSSQDHITINLQSAFHQSQPNPAFAEFHREAMMDHRSNQAQIQQKQPSIPYYLIGERYNTEDSQPEEQQNLQQYHPKQQNQQLNFGRVCSSSLLQHSYFKILILLTTLLATLYLFQTQSQFTTFLHSLPKPTYPYPTHLHSSLWLKQYSDYQKQLQKQQQQNQYHQIPKQNTMGYYGEMTLRDRKDASMYLDIEAVQHVDQLPFCVVVEAGSQHEQGLIIDSILKSGYGNLMVLTLLPLEPTNKTYHPSIQIKYQSYLSTNPKTYQTFHSQLQSSCKLNSLITILRSPVHHNIFHRFNQIHQTWNTYLTYSIDGQFIQVYSFYIRVFELLEVNDFEGVNAEYLEHWDIQAMAMGLLELAKLKSKVIEKGNIFEKPSHRAYFLVNLQNQRLYQRQPYSPITRLSDDFPRDLYQDSKSYKRMFLTAEIRKQSYIIQKNLSLQKMLKAQQQQDLIYLPSTHSLSRRQYQNYNKNYNISQHTQKQLPFCVCVLSHNNVANNRYKKVMLSILQQNYTNYHIVFFDDVSSDATMANTIKFMKQVMHFPQHKITYVNNLQRKYATYNILNAAFNFCQVEDIQVLIDGDDEIIGTQVFQLLNGLYQADQNRWVMYTNFKTNNHQFGQSRPVQQLSQIISKQNIRVGGHFLGQLRSWKIPIIRTIPRKYHESRFNQWLDTVYDDALQHSLFQLSSLSRVLYVPQICYEYNREYGDNDDSTQQKLSNRFMTYQYLLGLPILGKLEEIGYAIVDGELEKYFREQLGSNTFTYTSNKKQSIRENNTNDNNENIQTNDQNNSDNEQNDAVNINVKIEEDNVNIDNNQENTDQENTDLDNNNNNNNDNDQDLNYDQIKTIPVARPSLRITQNT